MKRNDLFRVLDKLLFDAAGVLKKNYECYYPKSGSPDPNERDITTAFANATQVQSLNWPMFTEVPIKHGMQGNGEPILDMLLLPKPQLGGFPQAAILIESKNIFTRKQFHQIEKDFLKMEAFSGRPLQDGTDFPKARLHMALMMDWGSEDALKEKLLQLYPEAGRDDEKPVLKIIRPGAWNDRDQWLVGLCRWHGNWE